MHNDYTLTDDDDLLEIDNSVTIHVRNLQLMTEIYKTLSNLNPLFMKEKFIRENTHFNLRNSKTLRVPRVVTSTHGLE